MAVSSSGYWHNAPNNWYTDITYHFLLKIHGRKWQSISLSSSRFTLMTSHAPIHVMLLSLQKRCRTGSETVQLCINTINSFTCEPSVIHRTRLNFFKTYYTARVLQFISITVIKNFTSNKLQLSDLCANSTAAPVQMEFHNFYIIRLFITVFTMACHWSILHNITKFHTSD